MTRKEGKRKMKKQIIAAAFAAVAAAASAELKIGTVDMIVLVRNHASYESNKELLTSTERDGRKALDALKDDLDAIQEEGRKIAEELKNPMLAQAAKDKAEKEFVGVQRRYLQTQQKIRDEAANRQRNLAELEAKLLKGQASDLKKRIAKFAADNGYDLIVDASAALFAAKGLDLTDAVLKDMGVDPKAAREKMKDDEGK